MFRKSFFIMFLLLVSTAFAYDLGLITDKHFYAVNESIFAIGGVKINVTPISNVSVVFSIINQAGSAVSTATFVTNSSGQFNSTFQLTAAGNYSLRANVSGDVVEHFIKVLAYKDIMLITDRASYTGSGAGTLIVSAFDINGAGVSGQAVTASIRYQNGTLISSLTPCTTDSLGQCQINFTSPSADGVYVLEVNNFENSITLVVGGYDAFMKISPSVVGKSQNVTIRVTVKNSNGNGITASTRQLVITAPSGSQTTLTSMTPANDSSGASVTGVYEDKVSFTEEGTYAVKATIQPQGSNLTRELTGSFSVSSYLLEVFPWSGSSAFTPGETASLAIRLRNASSNEFMRTTQCGSGSCVSSLSSATVLDPSGVSTGYAISVSEQTSLSLYRMDITIPGSAKSGSYKVAISLNDSFGTGYGTGYFSVQLAKGKMRAIDKFPGGVSKETFLPGKQIVLEFLVNNATGAVAVTDISSYSIRDEKGNDKTATFSAGADYLGGNNKSYINLTAPKSGGRFNVKAKLTTALGSVDAEGWLFIDVLDITIRPKQIGAGGSFTPFGGPGYMFAFRPNDTVQLSVTVETASEKRGSEGFMGGGLATGGTAAGGHSVGFGGLFGIGGGTAVQGAQVIIDKIINLNTEEDITTSTTITNCITDTTGSCTASLQSSVNAQNWTGGFHIVFVNVTTSDNQSDDGEGFFEVRRYMVNVQTRAATAKNATGAGFMSFNDWFIGPDDNINITIQVIEPGTWQSVQQTGLATIQGVYYTGNIGEFIFPPKLQDGTTATANITSGGVASRIINAPSGGWKSGFYIVKVLVNVSNVLDTGESFLMVKIYQGFGFPINPTTKQQDFTVSSGENASIQVNVFDVKKNRPAANLTVTLGKILSFESFPPSELSYDKSQVSTGTTDANGQVVMNLPVPSGGWSSGNLLVNFDVTNGTVSDSIQGFFQVKNFFVELSGAKWRFATTETVAFNATISSDPSWMRQQFGGGCPAGDPMCSGGGGMGPPPVGGGGPVIINHTFVGFGNATDLDGDGQYDINITAVVANTPNLTVINGTAPTARTAIAANFWCITPSQCQTSPTPLSTTTGFDGVDCDAAGAYSNTTSHNMSGPAFFCVQATSGDKYKVQTEGGGASGMNIGWTKHVAGSVGGVGPVNLSGTQGFSYYNATLKTIKVIKFSFESGETVLSEGVDYNLTSATGSTVGSGKIVIPGVGSFKIVPLTPWSTGFYRVIAEFNTTPSLTETGDNGFSIETFFANCFRYSWGAVASGVDIQVSCDVTDPGTGSNYTIPVDMQIESVRNMFTFQNVASGAGTWTSTKNNTNATGTLQSSKIVILSQNLGNGQYEATIKLNASATNVKTQSIWFEVKDFEPSFYSERWSYSSSDNVTLRAQGISGPLYLPVNLSYTSGSPEIVVYRYDKSTGAKSTVTGLAVSVTNGTDFLWPFNATFINLTNPSGWDEGSYEVVANITRMNAARTAPTGSKVNVRAWFDVRLFDVWGWSESWNNHPKSNVSLRVHVGTSGNWWQNYNGNVRANITAVTNTQTGAVLTKGTHYNVADNTSNPAVSGDLILKVLPLGSGLSTGSYRAAVQVADVASGKAVTTDVWFEVRAFYFYAYTERYEYGAGEDISFIINAYSTDGTQTQLSNAKITSLSKCTTTTCSSVALSDLITAFNGTVGNYRLIILNSSTGLTTGSYWADILVNDTQNATGTGGSGFRIKSFGVSGYVHYPSPSGGRYSYYINESMVLNVTGTIGANVTNATFKYWECFGTCIEKSFALNIGRILAAKNELINMSPPGLNSTWPTGTYWYNSFNIEVASTKDGGSAAFFTYGSVIFPYVWNITSVSGSSSAGPSDTIVTNVTVCVDYDCRQRLAGATVNVTRMLSQSVWGDLNSSAGSWNHTGAMTNANGFAQPAVGPNTTKFNWTVGGIAIEYTIAFGNATTRGTYYTTIAQKNLIILGKSIKDAAGVTLTNATRGVPFNISVTINNPESAAATTSISLSNNALNSSALANNITANGFSLTSVSIPSGASATYNFTMNVTGVTNVTSTIQITPSTAGFTSTSTSLTFRVN